MHNFENHEKKAKSKFEKAISLIGVNKIGEAYGLIREGYESITCDCQSGDWFDQTVENISLRKDSGHQDHELYFIKSFTYCFLKKYQEALLKINEFIQLRPDDEIGYYFKGKILLGLSSYHNALECFHQALKIKHTSRSLYRIGRTKEQFLKTNGIDELYQAILLNSSSGCCHWHLAEYAMKRRLFDNTEFEEYQQIFDHNDDQFPVKIGLQIEEHFANQDNQHIDDYMEALDRIFGERRSVYRTEFITWQVDLDLKNIDNYEIDYIFILSKRT